MTLAIALTLYAADCIDRTGRPITVDKFTEVFNLPSREVYRVAEILGRAKILLPVADGQSFVLSQCATRLTVADVINACLDNNEGETIEVETSTDYGPNASIIRLRDEFSNMLTKRFSMTIMDVLIRQRDAIVIDDKEKVVATEPLPTPPQADVQN
jgi:hypothetical protein